jgi:acetyltransferase-like isoleucine patch superfamily enzyme
VHIEGNFEIGNSFLNSDVRIICEDKIVIGDGCSIGWGVEIVDSDRHNHDGGETTSPINIADDVWIGSNVKIKKGVEIGKGAIIASNSVVANVVPEETLVAGVPAEIKKVAVDWER